MSLLLARIAQAHRGGGGPGDPYWSYVKSLLHMDGTNGSTTFTDERFKTWTANGAAVIATSTSKFGGASLNCGTQAGFLTTPATSDYDLGSNDFTLECFYRLNTAPSHYIGLICKRARAISYANFALFFSNNGKDLLFQWSTTGSDSPYLQSTLPSSLDTSSWHHVAISRNGSYLRLFLDGVVIASSATMTDKIYYEPTIPLMIGKTSDQVGNVEGNMDGYIDEVRITNGAGRYTGAFTPPAAPFPNHG